jgi:hypothetical protein
MTFILVLIYSDLTIVAEPRIDRMTCLTDAKSFIGTILPDSPIDAGFRTPKVTVAFCTEGYVSER